MSLVETQDAEVDFAAAETFLKQAREAYEDGDRTRFIAARKLVAIALRISEGPSGLRSAHLR